MQKKPGGTVDFKDWAQCPGFEDSAVNITNVFIDHVMGGVKVSCELDVQREFGKEEFSVSWIIYIKNIWR